MEMADHNEHPTVVGSSCAVEMRNISKRFGQVLAVEMRDISKRFGQVLANDRVSIRVPAGTIHAMIGENGAGKSTAMKILYGFYTAESGEILIDGNTRSIKTPADAIRLGLGMVHQ